jgi:hypothetical protein
MNAPTVSDFPIQAELVLPPRLTLDEADRIRDQLAVTIEDLNASTDPAERVGLHLDVQELRDRLAVLEGRK